MKIAISKQQRYLLFHFFSQRNPAQRVAQGNPISNCIVDLLDGCGSSANDLQQRLANTAAEWYDEACVPGKQQPGSFIKVRSW